VSQIIFLFLKKLYITIRYLLKSRFKFPNFILFMRSVFLFCDSSERTHFSNIYGKLSEIKVFHF